MRWASTGIVLSHKQYSDELLLASVLTEFHGKKRALTKYRSHDRFSQGNIVHVYWSGKSGCSLGYFTCEVIEYFQYYDIQFEQQLIMSSILSLIDHTVQENEVQTQLFLSITNFLKRAKFLCIEESYAEYIRLEVELLKILGFELDLRHCALTLETENLKYISPKTGQAISEKIGNRYSSRLFPFPNAMRNDNIHCSKEEFKLCTKILGYFFEKHVFQPMRMVEPNMRKILSEG